MFTDRRANSLATKRLRQPWPTGKPFKILTLDGGGIKGIYAAELLRRCEQSMAKGQQVASYFDMIAGTSTGGIIALGLGLKIPTDDIYAFYQADGREIFPPAPPTKIGRLLQIVRNGRAPKLRHDVLEEALQKRFGEAVLGDSCARLVIPAFMMPKTEIAVFKTDHHSDYRHDHAAPMWKVARSTSAAPTFLKGLEHEESGRIFIDGGVWANNPVMVAVVDALSAYDLTFDQIRILSIGAGNPPFELKRPAVLGGWFSWKEVIKAAMFLTTDNATAQAKLLLGPQNCTRIEPTGDSAAIEMDDYDRAITTLPDLAHQDFDDFREELAWFFQETVSPRERHYSER